MNKLTKKLAAIGAAMMMSVSMMSISSLAYHGSTNWRVSNINNDLNLYYTYRADGHINYRFKCTDFVGSGGGRNVKYYGCYLKYDINVQAYLYTSCTNVITITAKHNNEKTWSYLSGYIPQYNDEVKAWFNLDTLGPKTFEVTSKGYIKTNS